MKNKTLTEDLDLACIRYTEIRIAYFMAQINEESLEVIEVTRTRAHDALIACFNSVLRNLDRKPKDMIEASINRVEIGKWAVRRALFLVTNGTKSFGDI